MYNAVQIVGNWIFSADTETVESDTISLRVWAEELWILSCLHNKKFYILYIILIKSHSIVLSVV